MPDMDTDADEEQPEEEEEEEEEEELSAEEIASIKAGYDCIADGLNYIAALSAAGAAVLGGLGAVPGAVAFGVASGAAWALGTLAADLAEDPPQRKYKKAVKVKKFKYRAPSRVPRELTAFKRVAALAVKNRGRSQALLDALERYQGAKQAKDRTYAKIRARECRKYARQAARDFTRLRVELEKGFRSLDGTLLNFRIDHDLWKRAQQDVKKRGLPSSLRDGLRRAGLTPREQQLYRTWFTGFYRNRIKPARVSYHVRLAFFKLAKAPRQLGKL